MNKKLIAIIAVIVVIIGVVVLGITLGKGNNKGNSSKATTKISQNVFNYFDIEANVEETQNENGEKVAKYNFTKEEPQNAEFKKAGYYLVTDKVVLAVKTNTYAFHTSLVYKEKHGEVTPSFELFKEYVLSDEYTGTFKNVEVTKFNGFDAMKMPYEYTDSTKKTVQHGYQYVISVESINPTYKGYVTLVITTPEGETGDYEAMMADQEVKDFLASINFVK